jgi:hypothetical protein
MDWATCIELFGKAPEKTAIAVHSSTAESEELSSIQTPTQVVLVDWLQFLGRAYRAREGRSRLRVGIVVSAWDMVPHEQQSFGAEPWLTENLPLLAQFIAANDESFEFAHFGVSTTGGDLKADRVFRQKYLEGEPREAGYVFHCLGGKVQRSTDLTLPVAWAVGLR